MARYKRIKVGQIVKGKDGKPDYIKVDNDVTLKRGDYLNLESAASQRKGIEDAMQAGKLSGEVAEKMLEKVNKIPPFVRFEIVKLEKGDD